MILKDIEIVVTDQDKAEELSTITPANVGGLLGAGWMFYFVSLFLNLVFYQMHPFSPEMWTWGAAEELEEWTPPEKTETVMRKQSNREQESQLEATEIELAELLPQGLNEDMINEDDDNNTNVMSLS